MALSSPIRFPYLQSEVNYINFILDTMPSYKSDRKVMDVKLIIDTSNMYSTIQTPDIDKLYRDSVIYSTILGIPPVNKHDSKKFMKLYQLAYDRYHTNELTCIFCLDPIWNFLPINVRKRVLHKVKKAIIQFNMELLMSAISTIKTTSYIYDPFVLRNKLVDLKNYLSKNG